MNLIVEFQSFLRYRHGVNGRNQLNVSLGVYLVKQDD